MPFVNVSNNRGILSAKQYGDVDGISFDILKHVVQNISILLSFIIHKSFTKIVLILSLLTELSFNLLRTIQSSIQGKRQAISMHLC